MAITLPQSGAVLSIERLLRRHGHFLLFLFLLGFGVYNLYIWTSPFDYDNVYALYMAASTGLLDLFKGARFGAGGQPFYRPVAHATLILQYRLFGLNTASYFLLNLLIWIACSWALYGIVACISKSRASAAIAAAFLLLAPPGVKDTLAWITGRQGALCVFFGAGALLLALRPAPAKHPRLRWAAIFLLLVASPLCKEFGLAAAGGVFLIGALRKDSQSRPLIAVAILAAAVYAVVRLLSGVTDYVNYGQTMGFFGELRDVSYASLSWSGRLEQYAYNVGASFMGAMLPGLIGNYGEIAPSLPRLLIVDVPMLLLALLGLAKAPRRAGPLLALVPLNAALGFVLFRGRDQLMGAFGVYSAAGIGLAVLLKSVTASRAFLARFLVLGALTGVLAFQTTQATDLMVSNYEVVQRLDPCQNPTVRHLDRELIYQIKVKFGLDNPQCRP